MSIVYLLMPFALLLGGGFLFAFVRMGARGQFDDLVTPAHRMLLDDESVGVNKSLRRKDPR